jgi:hypothetical protein
MSHLQLPPEFGLRLQPEPFPDRRGSEELVETITVRATPRSNEDMEQQRDCCQENVRILSSLDVGISSKEGAYN